MTSIINDHERKRLLDRTIPRPGTPGFKPISIGWTCESCKQEFRAMIESNPQYKATYDRAVESIKQIPKLKAMEKQLRDEIKAQRLKKRKKELNFLVTASITL